MFSGVGKDDRLSLHDFLLVFMAREEGTRLLEGSACDMYGNARNGT